MNTFDTFLALATKMTPKKGIFSNVYVGPEGNAIAYNGKESLTATIADMPVGLYNAVESKACNMPIVSADAIDKYPALPVAKETPEYRDLSARHCAVMVDAFPFVSDDETRYFMNGIHLGDGNCTASDGRRLYTADGFDDFPEAIIPESKLLLHILSKGENVRMAKVYCDVGGDWLRLDFTFKGLSLTYAIRLLEGQFPNWKRVMPESQLYSTNGIDSKPWKAVYKPLLALAVGKGAHAVCYIEPIAGTDSVKIYCPDKPEVSFTLAWPSFASNEELRAAATSKHKDYTSTLSINTNYLDSALDLMPTKICYTNFYKAFSFVDCLHGATVIIMPRQLS